MRFTRIENKEDWDKFVEENAFENEKELWNKSKPEWDGDYPCLVAQVTKKTNWTELDVLVITPKDIELLLYGRIEGGIKI